MNPISAGMLILCCLGVMLCDRRWAVASLLTGTIYLSFGAGLEVFGLNLFPARVLTYICFARVIFKRELAFVHPNVVDCLLVALHAICTLVLMTREDESIPLQIAKMLDAVSSYYSFRALVRSVDDLSWLLKIVSILLLFYVPILLVERVTQSNPFIVLGAHGKVWLREGTPRCFGSFRHPSLLGSLGACFLPLLVGLCFRRSMLKVGVIGAVLSTSIVFFSNSGGPVSAFLIAGIGWILWKIRLKMRLFRWGLLSFILILVLFMKAPIWYLPAKFSAIVGGTGWHRSYLMDVAFRNIGKWWMIGMPLKDTQGWFPYSLGSTGGADITNQFVSFGLSAGLGAIVLFLVVISNSYSLLGGALARLRGIPGRSFDEAMLWGCGVTLAVHIVNLLSITYYDQFYVIWFFQLAVLVSLSQSVKSKCFMDDGIRDLHVGTKNGLINC
jgi:hypothetical protein